MRSRRKDPNLEPDMVEVKGTKSVESAVQIAMKRLGIEDPDLVIVDVLVEPVTGFLGMGGHDGVVRVYREESVRRHGRVGEEPTPDRGREDVESETEPDAVGADEGTRDLDPPQAHRSSEERLEQAKKWMNQS